MNVMSLITDYRKNICNQNLPHKPNNKKRFFYYFYQNDGKYDV